MRGGEVGLGDISHPYRRLECLEFVLLRLLVFFYLLRGLCASILEFLHSIYMGRPPHQPTESGGACLATLKGSSNHTHIGETAARSWTPPSRPRAESGYPVIVVYSVLPAAGLVSYAVALDMAGSGYSTMVDDDEPVQ